MILNPWHIQTIIALSFTIIIVLAATLGWSLWSLLTQLNDPNPNGALTALLGTITGGLSAALVTMAASFGAVVGFLAHNAAAKPDEVL